MLGIDQINRDIPSLASEDLKTLFIDRYMRATHDVSTFVGFLVKLK